MCVLPQSGWPACPLQATGFIFLVFVGCLFRVGGYARPARCLPPRRRPSLHACMPASCASLSLPCVLLLRVQLLCTFKLLLVPVHGVGKCRRARRFPCMPLSRPKQTGWLTWEFEMAGTRRTRKRQQSAGGSERETETRIGIGEASSLQAGTIASVFSSRRPPASSSGPARRARRAPVGVKRPLVRSVV